MLISNLTSKCNTIQYGGLYVDLQSLILKLIERERRLALRAQSAPVDDMMGSLNAFIAS